MHKLERPDGPDCLQRYEHGRNQWEQVTAEERAEIWEKLDAMQGRRCAYCEAEISEGKRHIEHFRQKAAHRYPQGTFEWTNLFGSCDREESCGKHKDGCGTYHPADLIKPDVEDPEYFLLFISDGTIAVRAGLSEPERRRAEETLRVFNLDAKHGPLRSIRKKEVYGYLQTFEEYALMTESPEELQDALEREVAATAHLPFATAIKHTLLRQFA